MSAYRSAVTVDALGISIPHEAFRFNGGEIQVRLCHPLPDLAPQFPIRIRANISCSDHLLEALLVTDALRRRYGPGRAYRLSCPYLPYARQDRVCAPGEALSLRVFCDLINAQGYERVTVWDPHSDVATALLDRVRVVPQETFVSRITLGAGTVLVAPDAGAAKKVSTVSAATGLPYVLAAKHRDPATGGITRTTVDGGAIEHTSDLLIVDDICDGGRTFTELAKVLRTLTEGRILLCVTHGIFSQGLGVFDGLIDHVYCANVFPGVERTPLLTEI